MQESLRHNAPDTRRMYQRVAARWARGLLELRSKGLHRPTLIGRRGPHASIADPLGEITHQTPVRKAA